jgi:hypothetical protein
MKVTLTRKTTPQEIINLGWEVLTKEMGPLGATRFWMYVTRGEGDSVLEFKRMWKGKSVEEIHQEILKAKEMARSKK